MQLQGDQRLIASLDKLARAARRDILDDGVKDGAEIVEAAAKMYAPVRTGQLRRAIHTAKKESRRHEVAYGVGPSYKRGDHFAPYAHLVEYGHRVPGGTVRGADPFMRPAYDRTGKSAIKVAMRRMLHEVLRFARAHG